MTSLKKVEEIIKYKFKDQELLNTALTHKSYSYDNKKDDINDYNERLEFLGDAILEHIVSIYLYNVKPFLKEGIMSKKRAEIVCEKSLSTIAKELNLQQYLKIGKCETNTGGRKKNALLADMFEAILGAIYIDSNFETVQRVCILIIENKIKMVLNEKEEIFDYKTALQEILQQNGNVEIKYVLKKCLGEEHNKTFYTDLYFNGKKIGEGSGKNKKESEQKAAKNALQNHKDKSSSEKKIRS